MARALRRSVIVGEVTYPAGTPETPELAKQIPNPQAWEGDAKPAAGDAVRHGRSGGEDSSRGPRTPTR